MPRNAQVTLGFDALVEKAKDEIETVISELEDNLANMEEKFSGTERYQIFEGARDDLQAVVSEIEELDIPDDIVGEETTTDLRVKWPSKADRVDNAREALGAAVDVVTACETSEAEANDALETPSDRTERSAALRALVEAIEDIKNNLEGVAFS